MTHSTAQAEKILSGIACAPGICIGTAYLLDKGDVKPVHQYTIDDIETEKRRFRMAVHLTEEELLTAIKNVPEDLRDNANILKAHILLLKDKLFFAKILDMIAAEKVNAEWALKTVSAQLQQLFLSMTDSYLQERSYDIRHIAQMVLKNLQGTEEVDVASIDKRVILVARELSPLQASQIQLNWILGLVTQKGGVASHTSIIARTFGLPAVAGIDDCALLINHGEVIIVDGEAGEVIISPSEETLHLYQEKQIEYHENMAGMIQKSRKKGKTADGVEIVILGNIDFPEEFTKVREYGGEGIGLYRTEFQYLNQSRLPTEDELYERYVEIVGVLTPDTPIIIRTMDINGDKIPRTQKELHRTEANPALGLRGIRYGIRYPDILKTQLRAILRAAASGNVCVMFPLVSCVEEIRFAKAILYEACGELAQEGLLHKPDIAVGAMIEIPSAAVIADILAKEVSFFSIGTNDLVQYSLAIDRSNTQVADLFEPLSPAVLRLLHHTANVAKEAGIDISVCGEMAGDPTYLPILLGMGIRTFSMNAFSIPVIKHLIEQFSIADTQNFVKEILSFSTSIEIKDCLKQRYDFLFQMT